MQNTRLSSSLSFQNVQAPAHQGIGLKPLHKALCMVLILITILLYTVNFSCIYQQRYDKIISYLPPPAFHGAISLFCFPTTLNLPSVVSSTTNPASARRVFEASPSCVSDLITCWFPWLFSNTLRKQNIAHWQISIIMKLGYIRNKHCTWCKPLLYSI
jgi:hypothetical protein